jgi:hypothetical protein
VRLVRPSRGEKEPALGGAMIRPSIKGQRLALLIALMALVVEKSDD